MKKSIIIVIILIVTIIISAETYEYYQGLINNRIEVDTMYEGNYRVNFISNNQPITKEFTSYARLDTIESNGEVKIDSVMTYYILSLSPTRQSILIEEYIYPKNYYNLIKNKFKTDTVELRMLSYWDVFRKPITLKTVYLYNYKGEIVNEFDAEYFEFFNKQLKIYTYLNDNPQLLLLSDSIILCCELSSISNGKMNLYNLNGKKIHSFNAKCNINNNQYKVYKDTLFLIVDKYNSQNKETEKQFIIYKVYSDEIIDSILIHNNDLNTIIDGISINDMGINVFLYNRKNDQFQIKNLSTNNKIIIPNHNLTKRTMDTKIMLINSNIIYLEKYNNKTKFIVLSQKEKEYYYNYYGEIFQIGNTNIFVMEEKSKQIIAFFNPITKMFEEINGENQ